MAQGVASHLENDTAKSESELRPSSKSLRGVNRESNPSHREVEGLLGRLAACWLGF
jgi:hypothetical protein